MLKRLWCDDEGVLTFEWILLITVLVIGVIGAMSAVRDAINVELLNVAGAIIALDQSYTIEGPITGGAGVGTVGCGTSSAVGSTFVGNKSLGVGRGVTTKTVPGVCGDLSDPGFTYGGGGTAGQP